MDAVDCKPIYQIVADSTDEVYGGYFISKDDYFTMIDELNMREEAFRKDLTKGE